MNTQLSVISQQYPLENSWWRCED